MSEPPLSRSDLPFRFSGSALMLKTLASGSPRGGALGARTGAVDTQDKNVASSMSAATSGRTQTMRDGQGASGFSGFAGLGGGEASAVPMADTVAEDVSDELLALREHLAEVSAYSTVSVATLTGASRKSLELDVLARNIPTLLSPDEQVVALDEVLAESDRLPFDQHGFVLCRLISYLLHPQGRPLHDLACHRAGRRLLQMGMNLAQVMLAEGAERDALRTHIVSLAQAPQFGFPPDVEAKLEEAGFFEPLSDERLQEDWDESPEYLAVWLRVEIATKVQGQIEARDIACFLSHIDTLPEGLKGRSLVLLINQIWNCLRDADNRASINEMITMIDTLPLIERIVALEGLHNQINLMPLDVAKFYFPMLSRGVQRLAATQDFRYNRLRRDLRAALQAQSDTLEHGDFLPGESVVDRARRKREERGR